MVAAFDYCLHGKGGAAPSIDTAMHGLRRRGPRRPPAPRQRHRHRHRRRRRAAHQGDLRRQGRLGAVAPTRLPARARHRRDQGRQPEAIGCILGGHGITAWGATSAEAEASSRWIIEQAQAYLDEHGSADPSAQWSASAALSAGRAARQGGRPGPARPGRRLAGPPHGRSLQRCRRRPRLPASSELAERLAGLGTSCPDHFLRTKVRPLVLDLPSAPRSTSAWPGSAELHEAYRADYAAYYERHAEPDCPPMRGADPAIVLVPGVGMFSYGKDKQTARVAGEFYVNAINVMRGAESVSTYAPIAEAEKFRIEYWALEEAKLQRMPAPRSPRRAHRPRHRRRRRHRPGHRQPGSRPRAPAS